MKPMIPTGGKSTPIFIDDFTPIERPSKGLAAHTLEALRVTFREYGQEPTPAMWSGLSAVAAALERMANGICAPSVYVSSLDPGVGKTQLLVHFLRELLRSPDHASVGAIICVNRKEQIRSISKEASLDRFAVLTADPDLNAIATAEANEARVLFTTQQMVEARSLRFGSFAAVSAFHFNGNPRQVRVWDEAILPGQALMVSLDDLHTLPAELRRLHRPFTEALDGLMKQIDLAEDRQRIAIPDLPHIHEVSEAEAQKATTGRATKTVERVWPLFGRTVTVRRDYGVSILDYRDSLPSDLQPVVVLDASARVRTTYDLWDKHRGGMMRLQAAVKDYAGLTIGVWDRGGGKDAFARDAATMAEGIAKTISSRPDEEWLVVHHMPTNEFNLRQLVLAGLSTDAANVHFLTWGRHDATNEFAHIPNVILAGTLFKPEPVYEALGRLAAKQPSSCGPFVEIDEVKRGENAHGILQALCRGSVRHLKDGRCPSCRAFIIARKASGIPQLLHDLFPGAEITEWQPVPKQLKGQQEAAFDFIVDQIEADPSQIVRFGDVARHLDIDPKNFKFTRKHDGFRKACQGRGIEEWKAEDDEPRGFWHPFRYYFGNDDE